MASLWRKLDFTLLDYLDVHLIAFLSILHVCYVYGDILRRA